jgi:hypothetical protein
MGISDNLRKFMDPSYSEYDSELVPTSESEAANAWTLAIAEELPKLLSPMIPAQLNSLAISSFIITEIDITFPNQFDSALDSSIKIAADKVFDVSGTFSAPPISLDSKNTIFDPNPSLELPAQFTITEICQRAEDRIIEWLMTGTFTAYFYPPGTGVPSTPWILPPGETIDVPDSDGDGYDDAEEDDAGTDIDDKKDHPED